MNVEMEEEFEVTQDYNIAAHRIKNDMCARLYKADRMLLAVLMRHREELTRDEAMKIEEAEMEMNVVRMLNEILKNAAEKAKRQNAKGCMAFVIAAIAPLLALAGLAVVKVIA